MLRYAPVMAIVAIAAVATPVWSSSTALAQALMTTEAARDAIEQEFGVEVLSVDYAEIDGRSAFLVRVMSPAGDFNDAFQINTLAVDRATGDLIPAFRHGPSGYASDEPSGHSGSDDIGPALRRGSLR